MIGLEVTLNDQRVCTAAAGDSGVLSAAVTWVLRTAPGVKEPTDLRLDVGGLSSGLHLRWPAPRKLAVGDEVRIRVVETAGADPPAETEQRDPGFAEEEERRYYEELKRKFEDDHG